METDNYTQILKWRNKMPTTKLNVDEQVATKPEAIPDDGLLKIYQKFERAQSELRRVGEAHDSVLVEIIEYVKNHKLSKEIVRATLQKRGASESSINTEVSRIFKLASSKHEEILAKLKNREISQADARKLIVTKPQEFPARIKHNVRDRVFEHMYAAAKTAIADLKDDEGEKIFNSISDFTALASEAWKKAWDKQAQKVAEGAKSPAAIQAEGTGEREVAA